MFRNLPSIILFSLFIISLELYIYRALNKYYNKKKSKGRKFIKVLYFVLLALSTLSIIILMIWGRELKMNLGNFFIAAMFINMLSKLMFLPFILIDDIRRFSIFVTHKLSPAKAKEEHGISRSDFLTKMGIAVAAVPALSLPLGMIYGPYNYTLHRKKIKSDNLPKAFQGLKIAQLSDIHVGSFYNKEAVMKGIDLLLAQKPDVVFFTGDIVNDLASEMDDYYDVFSKVTAPMGVYSVLGNHDYGDYHNWTTEKEKTENFENVKAIHKKLGWNLLLDEHIYLEKDSEKIGVIGIENWGKGFHQIGDMAKAAAHCDAPYKILLSHDPTHWDEQVRKDYQDIDLTLAGHTHGAQMGIETHGFKWSPISLRYKKWAGLYKEDNQYLYINRGFGFLAYPGRIGIWPEVTILELT